MCEGQTGVRHKPIIWMTLFLAGWQQVERCVRARCVSVSGHDGHSCSEDKTRQQTLLVVCNPAQISVIVKKHKQKNKKQRDVWKSFLTGGLWDAGAASHLYEVCRFADTAGLTQVRTLSECVLWKEPNSSQTPRRVSLRHSTFLRTTFHSSPKKCRNSLKLLFLLSFLSFSFFLSF